MTYGEHGVEMNDVELECIHAADAFDNVMAAFMGFTVTLFSPALAIIAEADKPGSSGKFFADFYSGKFF